MGWLSQSGLIVVQILDKNYLFYSFIHIYQFKWLYKTQLSVKWIVVKLQHYSYSLDLVFKNQFLAQVLFFFNKPSIYWDWAKFTNLLQTEQPYHYAPHLGPTVMATMTQPRPWFQWVRVKKEVIISQKANFVSSTLCFLKYTKGWKRIIRRNIVWSLAAFQLLTDHN